ncbi:MAG: hypothetical protein ABSC87_02360 [Halobacteriota archaeon]
MAACKIRLETKATSETLIESLGAFLESPDPPPSSVGKPPFGAPDAEVITTAAFRDYAVTALRFVKGERGGAISDKRKQAFEASSPEHAARYIR